MSDQNPAPCLIGLDLSKHVQNILMITHSQGTQIEATEEGTETIVERPILGEHPEMRETADLLLLRNPKCSSFIKEQKKTQILN